MPGSTGERDDGALLLSAAAAPTSTSSVSSCPSSSSILLDWAKIQKQTLVLVDSLLMAKTREGAAAVVPAAAVATTPKDEQGKNGISVAAKEEEKIPAQDLSLVVPNLSTVVMALAQKVKKLEEQNEGQQKKDDDAANATVSSTMITTAMALARNAQRIAQDGTRALLWVQHMMRQDGAQGSYTIDELRASIDSGLLFDPLYSISSPPSSSGAAASKSDKTKDEGREREALTTRITELERRLQEVEEKKH